MTLSTKKEFGDFQTPKALADEVCTLLGRGDYGGTPHTVVEPTCGEGAFLHAAAQRFPTANTFGFEVHPAYVEKAKRLVPRATVKQSDFFEHDWGQWFGSKPEPILAIGNPPWVTNSALSRMESSNLPKKSNIHKERGWDAITGKSNFDISEWIMSRIADSLDGRRGCLAMLCKTSVARRVLRYIWSRDYRVGRAATFAIDSFVHFGASVNACLLVVPFSPTLRDVSGEYFTSIAVNTPTARFGMVAGTLVADVELFAKHANLAGGTNNVAWRSGVKHDCSKVMEIRNQEGHYVNGFKEAVLLEQDLLYPMLKSADLANNRPPTRWMIVPQKRVGEPTDYIRERLPHSWKYLNTYGDLLDRRKSTIYRKQPRFSVFGLGAYTFCPWKVAVSGFYRPLRFRTIGPVEGKPVVFDDTCYFLSCESEKEATTLTAALNSPSAQAFFAAQVFWDAKRPVTSALLGSLNLVAIKMINGT